MLRVLISDIQYRAPFIDHVIHHGSYQAFCHLLYMSFFLPTVSMSYTLVPLGPLNSLLNVSRSLFILEPVLIFCEWVCERMCRRWISLKLETQQPNEECQGKIEAANGFVLG